MLGLAAYRRTWGLAGSWGDRIKRFDAATNGMPPSFDARRKLMLNLGGWILLVNSAPWCVYFLLLGHATPCVINEVGSLSGLAVLGLVRLNLRRLASLLFIGAACFSIAGLAIFADIPDAAVPRTVHQFFIPLAISAVFLLQHDVRLLRFGLPLLVLLGFTLFDIAPADFGLRPFMSLAQRRIATGIDGVVISAITYLILFVMLREARESTLLERDFASAVASGEIDVFLQAQCLANGRIVGAEALMRWCHPKRGHISPAEFIPMAERSGLIIPAGELLLRRVCERLESWQGRPELRDIVVSVNVSAVQMFAADSTQSLLKHVPLSLRQRGMVKFELTESMFVADFEAVCAKMSEIRDQGIRMSLDDFGTGFSSLSYLNKLPLDQLKVDQSFVRDIPEDADAGKIARTIIQLGADLGLEVIAEGVETLAQAQALQSMGCELFQGYLFARPMPLNEFEKMAIDAHQGRRTLAVVEAQTA